VTCTCSWPSSRNDMLQPAGYGAVIRHRNCESRYLASPGSCPLTSPHRLTCQRRILGMGPSRYGRPMALDDGESSDAACGPPDSPCLRYRQTARVRATQSVRPAIPGCVHAASAGVIHPFLPNSHSQRPRQAPSVQSGHPNPRGIARHGLSPDRPLSQGPGTIVDRRLGTAATWRSTDGNVWKAAR
jgi:hypothetical protein